MSVSEKRRAVIAGNWKMFKTCAETRRFFEQLVPQIGSVDYCDIVVAPPFTALTAAAEAVRGSAVRLAAQDLYWEPEGAYTGEVSAAMLSEVGCAYGIVGHSERRQLFGETDDGVAKKIAALLSRDLTAIFCVGETLEDRESGNAERHVQSQLRAGLAQLTAPDLSHIIVAYEPVWAIGTGRTATPDVAQQMHATIRNVISDVYGPAAGEVLRILYGGSVKPGNIADLMAQTDIDGALVGGASLEAASFAAIVHYPEAGPGSGGS